MKYLLPLFLVSLFFTKISAQQDARIAPLAIDLKNMDLLEMTPINNKDLFREEMQLRKSGRPNHFAHTFHVDQSTQEIGKWTTLPDGSLVWRLRIHSKEAKSLNLGFSKYNMPSGGTLVMYTPDYKKILGPFTPADNEEHEELWTPVVDGDDLIVEVWLKENNRNIFELELRSVNHDFIGITSVLSGSCNLDVLCSEADGWGMVDEYRDIIQSVGLMQLSGTLTCTGFLVNNTAQDCTPLFMTANHCEVSAANAPSVVTYWNYQNSTCRQPGSDESGADGDGSFNIFNSGSVFRASWVSSDFAIVEFDDPVNSSAQAFRAGWNATTTLATSVVGIHHPSREEKRISFSSDLVTLSGWQGANNEDHVEVAPWDTGTTEGGSSGSPLFDQDKRIIGQLHGGNASCTNTEGTDLYGWFNTSWEGGGAPNSSLKGWLDPINSGNMTINGKNCSFSVNPENTLVEICAPDDAIYQLTVSDNFVNNVNLTITDLQAGLTGTFSNDTPAPGEILTLTISNTADLPFGTYQFAVNGTDGVENSTNSLILILNDGIPAMPSLTAPAEMSTDISVTPSFEWEITSANTYEIEVATDVNFTNIIITNPMVDAESFSTNVILDPQTTYFWRVRGNNLCGTGDWTTQSFTSANVVCNSTTAINLPIIIDDGPANTITSTMEFTSSGIISDLNVTGLVGTHSWISDLTFTLESPEGTSVVLISSQCGDEQDFDVNFDDQATASIPCPYTDGGTYLPASILAAFNGENSEGTWTLTVADDGDADGGNLDSWGLEICAIPEIVSGTEQLGAQNIELFPNPTQGNLTINLTHPFHEVLQGEVYDVNGRLLNNFKIPIGQRMHHLDLSNFPSGIYLVKLKHSNFISTNKVILN